MRIVSLCPSTTETLIDLGLAASLVGVTRYCIHPRAITKTLPKVGGTKDPDLEAIRRAAPDLVLLNEEENTREAYEALAKEHRVDVTFPRRVAEVPDSLRHLGRLTGTEAAAEARARELEAALAELDAARAEQARRAEQAQRAEQTQRAERAARAEGSSRTRFAYLIWREPWMAVGRDTYVSDLLERAGGENVLGDLPDRYPTITLDALHAARPALILLPDEPYRFRQKDADELARAIPGPRLELVSGDDLCWHGVRSIRGVHLAKALFAPGLPVSPPGC